MTINVRAMHATDQEVWLAMRRGLWPNIQARLDDDIERYFGVGSPNVAQAFLATKDTRPAGFIELNVRPFAEGSSASQVPYVEGWYVEPEYRKLGIGSRLVAAAEEWARAMGYRELASDVEIDNEVSQQAHHSLGFVETARVVCFVKQLT